MYIISGHQNEASVRSYNRDCSTARKQHLSHALAKSLKRPFRWGFRSVWLLPRALPGLLSHFHIRNMSSPPFHIHTHSMCLIPCRIPPVSVYPRLPYQTQPSTTELSISGRSNPFKSASYSIVV